MLVGWRRFYPAFLNWGRRRTLQNTNDIAKRKGKNAGRAYCRPSTKKVLAVMPSRAAMPIQLEYGDQANLMGRRERISGLSDFRK
jgi:hypothetical protein